MDVQWWPQNYDLLLSIFFKLFTFILTDHIALNDTWNL